MSPPNGEPPTPPGAALDGDDARLRPLLARAAGAALSVRDQPDADRKADGSVVTRADRDAEAILSAGLAEGWRDDALLGEEGTHLEPDGARSRWLIDPIDGTSAFVEGLAYWGPTVARVRAGRVQCGAMWLPQVREYYFFTAGSGGFRNGLALAPLVDAPVRRSSVAFVPSRLHQALRLDWPGKARNLGTHAAHLCLVAAGVAQVALIGPGWKPWDTAVGLALIDAVGGQARRLPDGRPLDPVRQTGAPFVAGTPSAVAWLLEPGRLSPLP